MSWLVSSYRCDAMRHLGFTYFLFCFRSVTVSHTGLTAQQTTENILAVVQHMVGVLPGGETLLVLNGFLFFAFLTAYIFLVRSRLPYLLIAYRTVGWKNISGLYVTTTKTTSIPLFVSTTSASSVQLPPGNGTWLHLNSIGDSLTHLRANNGVFNAF